MNILIKHWIIDVAASLNRLKLFELETYPGQQKLLMEQQSRLIIKLCNF